MRKALIIGIDEYPQFSLQNAVSDAKQVEQVLAEHDDGSKNFDCRTLTSDKIPITESTLRAAIREHFKYEADIALFYFAGHGIGNDYGGYLVPQDAEANDEGVAFSEVLTLANKSKIKEVIIILDCCYSGRMGNAPIIGDDTALLRKGVSILTSSSINQPSLEDFGSGVFTQLICNALKGEAADILGNITIASLYSHAEKLLGPWEQRPVFKAHLSNIISIRKCYPKISIQALKMLPQFFKHANYEYPLDPSYEPSSEPRNTAHEAIFATLQTYRDLNLVEPIGEKHMYYAAINNKTCRLTRLGQFYWTMVVKNQI